MTTKYFQELFDATLHESQKVLEVLHKNESIPLDLLSECLLHFVQQICLRSDTSENTEFKKNYEIIYILIDAGADIDKTDSNGNSSLFYAAVDENYQLCDILLQCGADMWSITEHGIPVYDYVSQKSTSNDLIDIFNKFYPGLWKAVECENIYQVRQLINYWCRTSLQKEGLTLKDIALQTGNEEIINLIFGVYESMDLIYHIFAKNTEAVKNKLETCKKRLRLNLRKMSDHGAPILYYLIQSRDVHIIELFIKYDCQIYTVMRDNMGNDMPVLFSALKPDMSMNVVEALLPRNKTQLEEILYKILYKGMTVLEVAMEKQVSPEIFKLLIDRGGPLLLCDRNKFNETVLDVAISHSNQPYIDVIDECVYEWIQNPNQYIGRRLKLALLGWIFEPIQYMENGMINENVSNFLSDINLLQVQIEEMSSAIENGDIQKFIELKNAVYDSKLYETNMLWHARVVGEGIPLLHRAVLFNKPEIVEIILDEKPLKESIDNLFDQQHRTALHYAFAASSAKKIQKLLLNCGCSEHVLDKMNREPLDFKDKQDSPAIIKLIDRLKSKNYSECEPDPWNSDSVNANPESMFEASKDYYNDSENVCSSSHCDGECEFDENSNCESDRNDYDDTAEEATSDDEEESHSHCHIS